MPETYLVRARFGLMALAVLCGATASVRACPFCTTNTTLTERISQSHAAFAVEWVAGREGVADQVDPGSTRVRIRQIFQQPKSPRQPGDVLDLTSFSPGRPGEMFLLFGHLGDQEQIVWDGLLACSPELLAYLQGRPAAALRTAERLPYFLQFLEHPDETIAVDAYSEFGAVPYSDVAALTDQLPREKLLQWVAEPDAATGRIARIAFYGMLLGLCGREGDAQVLERIILTPGEDFRIGIDGVMAGYLLLTGAAGLDVLEQYALNPRTPNTETYALQQAVRFMWEFGGDRIPKERLRSTLRRMLVDPKFAELAIVDLTRWEDLQIVDQLLEFYSREGFDNLQVQTAIARYYLTIAELDAAARPAEEQAAIERARVHLQTLRTRDPELVERALKRFYPGSSTGIGQNAGTGATTGDGASPRPPVLSLAAREPQPGAPAVMNALAPTVAAEDPAEERRWPLLVMSAILLAAGIGVGFRGRDRERTPGK